ncbi:MAG: restriction endonuclease subunit S [Victivallales bacterium]|nr:restriction endonuclease subunit S [Victivallales bacterium]
MILSDITTIFDCPHSTAPDEGEGYPLIRTPNIGKGRLILDDVHRVCEEVYNIRNRRAIPQTNDIIFAREAPAGNAAVITEGQKVCLGQRTVLIRPKPSLVDAHYLVYFLLAPKQQIKLLGYSHGATVGHVNIPDIANLPIELPLLHEQRKIASIIENYDNLIEVNNKRIKVLEQIAENLYKEWFVRFRFPGHETAEFENGIPKGWEYRKLDKLLNVKYGKDHKDIGEGEIPVIGSGGIMRFGDRALYDGETVLIPRKGSLNNIMYFNAPFWTVDTMFYSIPLIPNFAKYAYYMLSKVDMESYNSGAALPSMTTEILCHFKILVPDAKVLLAFDKYVSDIFNQKQIIQNVNANLIRQRDLLLPRLMSGKLELRQP